MRKRKPLTKNRLSTNSSNNAVRASDWVLQRQRQNLVSALLGGLDTKRAATSWAEFGFPENVSSNMLLALYRRRGLAYGAVGKVVRKCWQTNPWIIEGDKYDETKALTTWELLSKNVLSSKFWYSVREADRLRLAGKFAGIVLRVADGKPYSDPVTGTNKLHSVRVVSSAALTVKEWYLDQTDPETYGTPKLWSYTEGDYGTGILRVVDIHPDRIFILGNYNSDALGWLEPVYNNFISIEKVEGGSGESYLKNAARQLNMNFDKEVDFNDLASMYGTDISDLQTKFDEVARSINRGSDTVLITQGASVAPLSSIAPDPRAPYDVNLQSVAAGLDMPIKILTGNQTGERASSEDSREFNETCTARRADLSFDIIDMVGKLVRIGVLPQHKGEITVMWDSLLEVTQAEKLAGAKTMSEINAQAIALGSAVFSGDEIRVAAGYETEDDIDPLPETDED